MSALTCDQARLLLSDWLAAVAESADVDQLGAHLTECAGCRLHARAYCRLDRALSERTAQERMSEIESGIRAALAAEAPVTPPHRRWAFSRRWVAAAALLFISVGATLWLAWPASAPAIARLERVDGEVYVVTGQARELAFAGQELRSGQGLETVGEDSGAVVVQRNTRRLVMGPDSTLNDLEDLRMSFTGGSLTVDATGPSEDRPLTVMTAQAQVVANGVRMSLVKSPEATRVVQETTGSVRVTRRSDGDSVNMAPGTFSIARAEAAPMGSAPLPTQYTRPRASLPASPDRIWALTFAPDGRTLVTGGSGGRVRSWDPTRGAEQTPVALTDDLREDVRALAFSRDGRHLAAGGDNRPLTRVWDWDQRKDAAALPGHRTWIEALAFSADARTLVVAGAHGQESKQIHLWDFERRQRRAVLDGHAGGVWCVTFSPDGQTLASCGRDGVIKLWDFAREQVRQTLLGHTSEVYCLAFSPDGTKLVSSSRDKTVKIWDVATGQELHCLVGHSKEVRACAFAPDGRTVASGSSDGTLRLWRVADGQELATFKLPGSANAVAYSPDGRTLAAGGWYKTVQLWDLPAESDSIR